MNLYAHGKELNIVLFEGDKDFSVFIDKLTSNGYRFSIIKDLSELQGTIKPGKLNYAFIDGDISDADLSTYIGAFMKDPDTWGYYIINNENDIRDNAYSYLINSLN